MASSTFNTSSYSKLNVLQNSTFIKQEIRHILCLGNKWITKKTKYIFTVLKIRFDLFGFDLIQLIEWDLKNVE